LLFSAPGAKIPDDIFEDHIAKVKAKNRELTTASLLRIAKEQRKKDKDLRKVIIPDDLPPTTAYSGVVFIKRIAE